MTIHMRAVDIHSTSQLLAKDDLCALETRFIKTYDCTRTHTLPQIHLDVTHAQKMPTRGIYVLDQPLYYCMSIHGVTQFLLNGTVCLRIGTQMKLGSACKGDQMQTNGAKFRFLANFARRVGASLQFIYGESGMHMSIMLFV